ncbi:hypothetical protein D9M73_208530 [compost metagenome]
MGLGWRFVTAQHILFGKTVGNADGLQGDMRQLAGIACEDAQAIAAPGQFPHQLHRALGRARSHGQVAFMFEQPGMLSRRLIGRQCRQVREDIVLGGNTQGLADGGKIVHGHGQGAVHVEHPVANVGQAHAQSLR